MLESAQNLSCCRSFIGSEGVSRREETPLATRNALIRAVHRKPVERHASPSSDLRAPPLTVDGAQAVSDDSSNGWEVNIVEPRTGRLEFPHEI